MPSASLFSYLTHLECSRCGATRGADQLHTFCPACQTPLLARYDLAAAAQALRRENFAARPRGMWRWHELLPVQRAENALSLGEGDTPVLRLPRLAAQLNLPNLALKEESLNPTGTFKARGQAAAISRALELGARRLTIPTAGNAGGAMAAYAARAGIPARVFMPADTPRANIEECRIAGAEVSLVEGLINDAARLSAEFSRASGAFDVSTFKEPYRMEGKKIIAYEIAEAYRWRLPDVIIYPAGGGMGLAAMWKGFLELTRLGWLDAERLPRMVAVQASGCAPVVAAFQQRAETCAFWPDARTRAAGLRVPKSFGDRLILQTLYQSGGCAAAVSDDEMQQAQQWLAGSEGIFAAPEGAATLAIVPRLLETGWLQPDEQVLLLNTGSGLKYLD
ncbi:MAG: threonine synthase [Chloroflexota bacterium]